MYCDIYLGWVLILNVISTYQTIHCNPQYARLPILYSLYNIIINDHNINIVFTVQQSIILYYWHRNITSHSFVSAVFIFNKCHYLITAIYPSIGSKLINILYLSVLTFKTLHRADMCLRFRKNKSKQYLTKYLRNSTNKVR